MQALLRDGKLTAGHARTLFGAADPEARAREILAGAHECAPGRTAFGKQEKAPVDQSRKDPNINDLESSISNRLGLKVQIIHKGDKGGEVRIAYKTLEQLDEIIRRSASAMNALSRRSESFSLSCASASASAGSIRPS